MPMLEGHYPHEGPGNVLHDIYGLQGDHTYSVSVEVTSFSWTSLSNKHRFGKRFYCIHCTHLSIRQSEMSYWRLIWATCWCVHYTWCMHMFTGMCVCVWVCVHKTPPPLPLSLVCMCVWHCVFACIHVWGCISLLIHCYIALLRSGKTMHGKTDSSTSSTLIQWMSEA